MLCLWITKYRHLLAIILKEKTHQLWQVQLCAKSSDVQIWPLPELSCSCACAWPFATANAGLDSDLQICFLFSPQTYLVSTDLPCHHGLAWQAPQCWLILVIATSLGPFLQDGRFLIRLVLLCALLSPLAHLPLRRSPLLLLPDRCAPRWFGNLISKNNTREYCNPNLSTEINDDFVPCIIKSLLRHNLV